MKISFQKRLYIGFAAALILSALLGITSFWSSRRQAEDANWVKHTYQVMNQLEDIQKLLIDMETGSRGFRATGERKFMQPYFYGRNKILPAVENLKRLVADNPEQVKRADRLDGNINTIVVFWQEHNSGTDKDVLLTTTKEKEQMDVLRTQVAEMYSTEHDLLTAREEKNKKANNANALVDTVSCVLILAIISMLIYVILKEFNKRKAAENTVRENLAELEQLNHESSEQNWMLQGMAAVNDTLQGAWNIDTLCKELLHSLLDYTQIPAGAIYAFDEQQMKFVQQASEGLPAGTLFSFAKGESLAGKLADTRKTLQIRDIPADHWQLQSGTGKSLPGELLIVPFWYQAELKAVLELASFGSFNARTIGLLDAVSNNIGVAINAADARRKVMLLLEQVQEQREALVQQQEELRQSNEELHRQAEILQASEEELKVQEEELRQINSELEERNEAVEMGRQALAIKAHELETTGKYKSEFLANMSHELRTPLNSVLILANMLSENKTSNLSPKQVEYAQIIHKSGKDLLNLINDVLDLSKIEAGKIDFNFEQVPVHDIVEDMKLLFAVQAEEKGISFVMNISPALPPAIYTDKQRLGQVIKNLLSNAFKFTPRSGTVTLSLEALPGSQMSISVTDTGIGIAQEKQQLIFEAFQQADGSTNRKYGGTGLGLSISKELIRRLGGEIHVASEQGKGSTFALILPAGKTTQVETNLPVKTTETKTAAVPFSEAFVHAKITDDRDQLQPEDRIMLIIEDDAGFAGVVRDYAREKGYKAIVALQGDEGLYYARKYKPAAIILDMQLPVLDGGTILKMLKSDPTLKNIPVHVVSAGDPSQLAIEGSLAYLRKPVQPTDLEHAFATINSFLKATVKKVLVLSGDYLEDDSLSKLIAERHFDITCDYAHTQEEALGMLHSNHYDCLIADIGRHFEKGIGELQHIKEALTEHNIPIIIYMDKTLSLADELQLKRISDVVIRDSGLAKDRLMDELELFLYKVQQDKYAPIPRQPAHVADETLLRDKIVLIADDDMRNVFALSTLLEEQQMKVITAADGKEALEMLEQYPGTDIVLMDIMMPEMDGNEATRRIRNNKKFQKLPVIAVTAKAMQGDYEKSLQAGFSDYITKPIDSARLFSLMRVWLSQ